MKFTKLPVIRWDDIQLLTHSDYYDGPLSGTLLWEGTRYWYECQAYPWDNMTKEDNLFVFSQVFHLFELTDEEWAFEDEKHADFEKYVGTHTNYSANGTRSHEGMRPRDDWQNFYDKYRGIDTPILSRNPVAILIRAWTIEDDDS